MDALLRLNQALNERSDRLWNSFPCLPPTLLRAVRLEHCFVFHSSLWPFTTITFAVINFTAVHTDRCNCYARRKLHLLEPPTYSQAFEIWLWPGSVFGSVSMSYNNNNNNKNHFYNVSLLVCFSVFENVLVM